MARTYSITVSVNQVNQTLSDFTKLGWKFISQSAVTNRGPGVAFTNPLGITVGMAQNFTNIVLFFQHDDDAALTPSEKTTLEKREEERIREDQRKKEKERREAEYQAQKERREAEHQAKLEEINQKYEAKREKLRQKLENRKKQNENPEKFAETTLNLVSNLLSDTQDPLKSANEIVKSFAKNKCLLVKGLVKSHSGALQISSESFDFCNNCQVTNKASKSCKQCGRNYDNCLQIKVSDDSFVALVFDITSQNLLEEDEVIGLVITTSKNGIAEDFLLERTLTVSLDFLGDFQNYLGKIELKSSDNQAHETRIHISDPSSNGDCNFIELVTHLPAGKFSVFCDANFTTFTILSFSDLIDDDKALFPEPDTRLAVSPKLLQPNSDKNIIDNLSVIDIVQSNYATEYSKIGYESGDENFHLMCAFSWVYQLTLLEPDNQELYNQLVSNVAEDDVENFLDDLNNLRCLKFRSHS